ncbi:MAG: plasmid stabilization system [Phycisphaerales bacterium]|nr:plasmid stabilization system [Phycisphaerales bacterium]
MPQHYRVIVLDEAFDDLDRILEYIKQDSPQNAVQTLDRLWNACQSLAMFPRRYKVHLHRKARELTVHSVPFPPYIVYYRVDDATHVVRVLTIRHGAQRQPRRFK